MTWLQRYRLRRMFQWSLWLLPALAIAAVMLVAPLVLRIERVTRWSWFGFTPDGARSVLGALTASMLTFLTFVVSSMLIVVQLASAQLTPRVIAVVFGDRRIKWVLAAFTFGYTYTIAAAGRIEDAAPQLPVALAIVLNMACIAIFFWFAQELGYSLRPIAVLDKVGARGLEVIANVYPERFDPAENCNPPQPQAEGFDGSAVFDEITHAGPSGKVLAFGKEELVALAERAGGIIELVPQVGDMLAAGEPLFRVSAAGGRAIDAASLRACIAVGPERTLEQDPRFAFRIIVDIANKALSPAINDPTTAVLALDQLDRLLKKVGERRLDADQSFDAQGRLRFCHRTPDWADFVALAISEIRLYGAGSLPVARRLRALLEHLIEALPEPRRPALKQQLALLESATRRHFQEEADRGSAAIGDVQGIGGSTSPPSPP